jgi:Spherulation-specific family 4
MRRWFHLRPSARPVVAFVPLLVVLLVLAGPAPAASAQSMAVPAYFYPGGSPDFWAQMDSAAPTLQVAVVNPASGPGSTFDPTYASAVRTAQQHGITVVGYVDTNYGTRPLTDVEADIDAYYNWYHVNGIYFDRASTGCSLAQSYYAPLKRYVKRKGGTARTILGFGTQTNECYVSDADILLTFEGSDADYVSHYSAPSWVAKYSPAHFWHVIYDTTTVSAMTQAVQLSKQRGAGSVYVTPDVLQNPYDTLPTGDYWNTELTTIG